jgi:DNA-binding NarL/FixJ family response regulator
MMSEEKRPVVFFVDNYEDYSVLAIRELKNSSFYVIHSYPNGEECIRNMHFDPVLIIMNNTLPGMSGIEVSRSLKLYSPQTQVLILFEKKDSPVFHELIEAGPIHYLTKAASASKIANDILRKMESILIDKDSGTLKIIPQKALFLIGLLVLIAAGLAFVLIH